MTMQMYITLSEEDRIARYEMDAGTGELAHVGDTATAARPAPLAVNPTGDRLYVGCRDAIAISTFAIGDDGALAHIGDAAVDNDPCYLSTDCAGRFLLSAYYEGGRCAVHAIGDDGAAVSPPVEWLATDKGAHSMQTDPANRFAFVPHISGGNGPNAIFQFRFDAETGHITPNTPARVTPDAELGPRHFCFHPHKDILYFSDEQGCSVTAYNFDADAGTLSAFQTTSTLPDGYEGQNSCSQIQIAPSGEFLYAPNRGHNSIACFSVDAHSGALTPIGHAASEAVPRAFSIDPTGQYLYAAGLDTGKLAAYRIEDDGTLARIATYDVGEGPMWVLLIGD
ncbi:MAG: beta-propeller fold lactonase family protein [Chloroflexi bacterium]|nr:beta-propeller fold lactonase family protein [Chloroflexota bacterium]